jgi:hypothetical protein
MEGAQVLRRLLSTIAVGILAITAVGPASGAQPATVAAQDERDFNIAVQIDNPRPGERVRGSVVISGFAADRRSSAGPGVNDRDIQIWLRDTAQVMELVGYGGGNRVSQAAATALGPQFDQSGFERVWDSCAVSPGPYELVVWVSSLVVPGSRNYSTVDIEVEPCSTEMVAAAGGAAVRAAVSSRCRRSGTGWVCDMSLRAPGNAAPGSDVAITRESLSGNDVQIERWTCGPALPGLVLECTVSTGGNLMQGGAVTATFLLANGEQRVVRFLGRCDVPTPPRTACR